MITRLLRQDPAWTTMAISLPLSIFYGIVIRNAMSNGDNPGFIVFLMLVYFVVVAWITIAANISNRCSQMSLSLPLSTHKLWTLRIISLLSVSGFSLAVFAATTLGAYTPSANSVDPGILHALIWKIAAAMLILPFLLHFPKVNLYKIPGNAWYVSYLLIVVFALTLAVALLPLNATILSLALAAALILGLSIYLRMPRSLSMGPREAEDEPGTNSAGMESEIEENIPRKSHLYWITFRILSSHWIGWLGFISLVAFSMTLQISYFDGRSYTPQNFVLGLWFWALLANGIARMYKVDAWPIPRRRLMALTVLPGFVAILLGMGATQIIRKTSDNPPSMIEFKQNKLSIPPEFLEFAGKGLAPEQIAPWGEVYRPELMVLWHGVGIYNPYETDPSQSVKYRAWQTERAVNRVHEKRTIDDWSGPVDDEFRKAIEAGSLRVLRSAGEGSFLRSRVLALGLVIGITILGLLTCVGLRLYRGYTGRKNWAIPTFVFSIMALFALVIGGDRLGLLSSRAWDALPLIFMRRTVEALAVPNWLLWTLVAVCAIGAYRLIEMQFARAEVSTTQKPRPAIQEW
jgi:hypothetical protein